LFPVRLRRFANPAPIERETTQRSPVGCGSDRSWARDPHEAVRWRVGLAYEGAFEFSAYEADLRRAA